MYVYDRKPHVIPNRVLGSQGYRDAGSGQGLGGVSGVRFGRVDRAGTSIHRVALAGGTVEARSNEVLVIEETKNGTPTGKSVTLPGFLALEYQGPQAGVSKWLQFAWYRLQSRYLGLRIRWFFPGHCLQSAPVDGRSQQMQRILSGPLTPRVSRILFTSRQGD
jgi:hypothetical protein